MHSAIHTNGVEQPGAWSTPAGPIDDPESLAEYLRSLYRDYIFNSPLAFFISIYFYVVYQGPPSWRGLQLWLAGWLVYLWLRFLAGLYYARHPALGEVELKRWYAGAVFSQALDSFFVTLLATFIYLALDAVAQSALLAATLVLAGSSAFSLSGRWLVILVYAPPVYLSFAWMTWQQSHPYAAGLACFVLAMFGLYMV